jgi:hypothetical protein
MKIIALFFILVIGDSLKAQTNDFIPFLFAGNECYTNAQIIRANPAYAVVDHAGGITKIAMSNLPAVLQRKFDYSPSNAAAFLAAENKTIKQRTLNQAKRQSQINASQKASRGTAQVILVESIVDESFGQPKCDTTSGTILLRDLPESTREFLLKRQKLAADIDALENSKIVVRTTAQNTGDDVFYSQMAADNLLYNALLDKKEKLASMRDSLKQMESQSGSKTSIRAYFTGQSYGGFEIWEYVGIGSVTKD